MAVEHQDREQRAQERGKGHGADSGAYRRRSIAREGDGGAGGGREVEGNYVDEDIGSLWLYASAVFLAVAVVVWFVQNHRVRGLVAIGAAASGGGSGGASVKHTDNRAAVLAERTGG